ncbi:hypothetical protein DH09_17595 [Bacillaceae bacterium JMAK1]|nr:hypothetical protein DH09_17595 [Bacillaceae bacterium JMAK1]
MFSLIDWFRLFMAALFILPIVTIIRESGYYLVATLLRGENKKLIVGSGPILFTIPTVEVRRYFFMYSWMEYDELKPKNRFWHGLIYAAPIMMTGGIAFTANSLVLNGVLADNIFWTTFIFYCFYYVLFDVIPVYLPDGQPTNGRAIFDLIWHGERSDFKRQKENNHKNQDNQRSYTEAQEETMQNRDQDDEERGDHTKPSSDSSGENTGANTESQKKTKENRDRDEAERDDHTNP